MSATDDMERTFTAYGRIVDIINREDGRVSDGLKWGFGANGALLSFIADQIFSEKASAVARISGEHGARWQLAYATALTLIAYVALALTLATYRQVRSARSQIIVARKAYEAHWKDRVERDAGLPRPYGSRYPDEPSELRQWWPETALRAVLIFWWFIVPVCALWLLCSLIRVIHG